MATALFEAIQVNLETGAVSYPSIEGFELDKERVYSTAKLFMQHCGPEMAVRHAIHGQIAAYLGAQDLFRRESR